MARRGEVLVLRRRIGFGAGESRERFVVLSSERFASALETLFVAPLDRALASYDGYPGVVRVTGPEAGGSGDHVLVVSATSSVARDRFDADSVGRLRPATLAAASRILRLLLDLP